MHFSEPPEANGTAISLGMRAKSERGYVIGAARLGYVPSRTHASLGVEHVPDSDAAFAQWRDEHYRQVGEQCRQGMARKAASGVRRPGRLQKLPEED